MTQPTEKQVAYLAKLLMLAKMGTAKLEKDPMQQSAVEAATLELLENVEKNIGNGTVTKAQASVLIDVLKNDVNLEGLTPHGDYPNREEVRKIYTPTLDLLVRVVLKNEKSPNWYTLVRFTFSQARVSNLEKLKELAS